MKLALFGSVFLHWEISALSGFFLMLLAVGSILIAFPMLKSKNPFSAFALFLMTVGGMALTLFSREWISFFIGWEIMTWSSYLLILHSPRATLESTQSYILFNLTSAFLLLGGILTAYGFTGSFTITSLASLESTTQALLLVLFGVAFLIKVGTLPLHHWVPSAYDHAPDTFSGFLSGLISKMGVYGLILLLFTVLPEVTTLAGTWLKGPAIGYLIAWIGVITSIVATFKAISQDNIKRLLAYSSIAQVGYITTAIGVGSSLALGGALFHALVHTVVKLLLFISFAGIILQVGKRHFSELGALIYKMPVSFFGVLIGIIGLAGMPPLPGFASKYLIYVSLLDHGWLLLLAAMILSSTAAFLYCYRIIYGIFLGHPATPEAREAKEAPMLYLIPQILLMVILALLGLFPGLAIEWLINPVVSALGMEALRTGSWGAVLTPYGGYDGVVLMVVFGCAFAFIAALFFSLRGRLKRADQYDLSYCGEVPDEKTPLHYGGGMGREHRRIPLVNFILERTTQRFYQGLVKQVQSLGGVFGALYSGNVQHYILLGVLGFTIALSIRLLGGF